MIIVDDNKQRAKNEYYEYYFKKENKKLLRTYGGTIFQNSKILDLNSSFPNLLENHKIDSKFRTKLVDWLYEVFEAIKCSESTMYLTLQLLDAFLYKYNNEVLVNDNIHLIGVCCLFIASKHEDITPLFMQDLKQKICHNRFSEKEIKEMERLIIKVINFQILIHSMGDFIKSYFYEFKVTNKTNIISVEQEQNFKEMEIFALYISKVITHSEIFSTYKNSIKSIACIVIAFEIVRTQKKMSRLEEELNKKWIISMIESSQFDPEDINNLYNKIAEYYTDFQKLQIPHNLVKMSNLPY